MLTELRSYGNIGTPNYFFELLNILKKNQEVTYTKSDIDRLFFNRIVDGRSIFDGCLNLAIQVEILSLENNKIVLNPSILDSLNSITQMTDKFVEFLFKALMEDDEFHNIFCSTYLSHDIIYRSLQINNNAFGLKYSNFKQLLLDFGAIKEHPASQLSNYIINNRYKKLFDKTVLPEIKRRKIGIEELRLAMELQQIYGEEAEKYVVTFEHKRLNGLKEINWVAEYIANEGYDIASYNTIDDEILNRFIEVKSYDGNRPYFYWSRNEYTVAQRKHNEYWLYLINRSKMNEPDYLPLMIQNPVVAILEDDITWSKQVEKYKIEMFNLY